MSSRVGMMGLISRIGRIGFFPIVFTMTCFSCAGNEEGSGTGQDDLVVARVGKKAITAEQLQEYIDSLPAQMDSSDVGSEELRGYLQVLIDRELLLMEAGKEGTDQSLAFLRRMHATKKSKLVSAFEQREIEIEIADDELQEYAAQEGYTRALRLSDIMVASEDSARIALEEIEKGRRYEEVARKWSVNRQTSVRGGDIGAYVIKEQMVPVLQDELFSLAVGEVSRPMRIGNRYSLFKVMADTVITLDPRRMAEIRKELQKKKFALRRSALVEDLKRKYDLKQNHEGVDQFIEKVGLGATFESVDERNIVLFRYDGGVITAGEAVDIGNSLKGDVVAHLTDRERVISFAEHHVIPDIMIMQAALRAKLDKEKDIVEWLGAQREQLLMMVLRATVLVDSMTITDDEVRAFYDNYPDKYMHPEQTDVQEVLVATEAEAMRLVDMIKKGAELGELARTYSIRSSLQIGEDGRFHFHSFEKPRYGGLVEATEQVKVGELMGPVRVKEGYSIFKVLFRGRKWESFEDVEWRVRSHLNRELGEKAFDRYIEGLRNKYESQVSIREDHLKEAFRNPT